MDVYGILQHVEAFTANPPAIGSIRTHGNSAIVYYNGGLYFRRVRNTHQLITRFNGQTGFAGVKTTIYCKGFRQYANRRNQWPAFT